MKTLLTIQSGTSRVTPVSIARQEEAVMNYLQTEGFAHATVVVWQVNTIRWGKWEQGTLAFADGQEAKISLWLECRIFNDEKELHLTRQKNQLSGRLVEDGAGEATEYVDACSRFWGECKACASGWMTLRDDDRKLSLTVPAAEGNARFYGLVTRNYIGIHEKTAQAGYTDYRYVKIASADQDVKGDA